MFLVVHLVTTVQSARLAIMFGSAAEPSLSVGEFKGFTVRMDPNFDEETNQWALSQDKTVNLGTTLYRYRYTGYVRLFC